MPKCKVVSKNPLLLEFVYSQNRSFASGSLTCFKLASDGDRTKHSGENPAMDRIQRVPVDKTTQARRVENGSLVDI